MLLFQLDCPALLAGCGPPDRVGKSLVSELAGSLTSSAHVLGGCGGILRADAVVSVMSSNAGKSRSMAKSQMPRGDNAATNPHHNNNSRMFEDTPRCKLHERLPAPQSQRISPCTALRFHLMLAHITLPKTHLISIGACEPPPPMT